MANGFRYLPDGFRYLPDGSEGRDGKGWEGQFSSEIRPITPPKVSFFTLFLTLLLARNLGTSLLGGGNIISSQNTTPMLGILHSNRYFFGNIQILISMGRFMDVGPITKKRPPIVLFEDTFPLPSLPNRKALGCPLTS